MFVPVKMVIIAQTLILLILPAQVSNFSSVKMLFGIVTRSDISFAFLFVQMRIVVSHEMLGDAVNVLLTSLFELGL